MPRRRSLGSGPPRLFLAALLLGALLTASAQTRADDAQDCGHSQDWALVVRACSAVIAHEPGSKSVAWAYNKRGLAQENLNQAESALRDYSTAISVDPGYVEAYVNRGGQTESRWVHCLCYLEKHRHIMHWPSLIFVARWTSIGGPCALILKGGKCT